MARILIVEDEFLIAANLAAIVRALGHEVVGPHGRLDAAMRVAEAAACDAALLDVRLGRADVYPVADALRRRSVPYGFVTANSLADAPAPHRDAPAAAKPFSPRSIAALLDRLIDGHSASS